MRSQLGNERNWREKKNNYVVIIETLVFQGQQDTVEAYLQEVNLARNEALAWITNQGVDVNKDVVYEFIPSDAVLTNPTVEPTEEEILLD